MKKQEKQDKEEKQKELMEKLEEGIKAVFTSERYTEYLKLMGKFHSYSFNNTILIQMQKPDATYLAGYKTWETLERHVKKGERGIMILAPNPHKCVKEVEVFDPQTGKQKVDADGNLVTEQKEIVYATFRPITIFDISQTEGKPLPELAQELHGDIKNYGMILDAVKNTASVPIEFESWEGSKKGYYNFVEQRIGIKEGMSELQTVKTAIHELTHSVLHTDKDKLKDAATMEVEAESVAFVVCNHFGLDTSDYSFGYLAGWSSNRELPELKSSLQTIQKTAHDLIDRMEEEMLHLSKQIECSENLDATRLSHVEASNIHHHRR